MNHTKITDSLVFIISSDSTTILDEGVEMYARAAYTNFNRQCGDVAFALIRDLGAPLDGMTVGASLVHLGVGGEHLTGKDD